MDNTARPLVDPKDFQPRASLKRNLTPAKWMRSLYYFCLLYSALSLYLSVITEFTPLNILVTALIAMLAQFVVYPSVHTSMEVTPEGVKTTLGKRSKEILFKDVTKISYIFAPYFGGFIHITNTDGKRVWFTGLVRRAEYILEALLAVRPELDSPELRACRRHLIKAEHDQSRVGRAIGSVRFWAGLAMTGVFAWAISAPIHYVIAALLTSLTSSELLMTVAHERALKNDPNNVRADLALERNVSLVSWIFVFIALGLVTYIAP